MSRWMAVIAALLCIALPGRCPARENEGASGAARAEKTTAKEQKTPKEEGKGKESPAAAGKPQETVELGEVVVSGKPTPAPGVEVITSGELAEESLSNTVEGRMKHLPGVDLHRRGPAGAQPSRLSIRGLDESRCDVLLDGRTLKGSGVYGGYYVDWDSLSVEGIDSIEVIRGLAPAKYGNTLGGVVNLVTSKPSRQPRTEVRTSVSDFRTWEVGSAQSGSVGRGLYNLAFGHYESDGYLRNAFSDRDTLSGKVVFSMPDDYLLTLSGRYSSNKAGMIVYNMPDAYRYDPHYPDSLGTELGGPGLAWLTDATGPRHWGDGSRWKDDRLQLDLALSRERGDREFTLRAYYMDQDRREYFRADDDPGRLVLRRDSKPEKNNWGWRGDFKTLVGEGGKHVLEYGAEGQYLGFGASDVISFDPSYFSPWRPPFDVAGKSKVTRRHGLYAQDTWQARADMEVQFGLRLDAFVAQGPEAEAPHISERHLSPRLRCEITPWEGGAVSLRWGRAYRFPTIPEYYWWYSGYDPARAGLARKGLSSERADEFELEVSQQTSERLDVSLTGYWYSVDNYLRTIFGYRPSRVVYNIDEVDLRGLEAEASYSAGEHSRVWANYTYQDTDKHGDILDHSGSGELPELPKHKFNLGFEYASEDGVRGRLDVRYVGNRRAVRGDLTAPGGAVYHELPSFVDVSLHVEFPLRTGKAGPEARFRLAVENMLDQEIVEEYGYPFPGTTVMAGVSLVF